MLAQANALIAVERVLDDSGIAAIVPDWPARRRAHLLAADLHALELELPIPSPLAPFDDPSAMLGAVYVIEGSRLGGTLLKQRVSQKLPTAFLSSGNSTLWRMLLEILDERLRTADQMSAAIAAAGNVFALFERSGRRFLKVD